MLLQRISILNYKNLSQVDLEFSKKFNCFIGENGMGKTNLLDAIYYLSFCKSNTNPMDSQNILHDEDFFMIQGFYETAMGENEEIYAGVKRRQKKKFKRNKKEYERLSDHIGFIPLVLVSPSDSILIEGGSKERRKFLDVVISQYDKEYLDALIRYNKALEQRNVLLKSDTPVESELLLVWEETMAQYGTLVHKKRTLFISSFIPIFQEFYSIISQEKEKVRLAYESHATGKDLLKEIIASRPRDLVMGYSLVGIHRDDLIMELGGFPIKREGSQGQSKTFLIALKLAQFDFLKNTSSVVPLLLLDDIFDKLDATRVEQIVNLVSGSSFGQIFITDTNRQHLDKMLLGADTDYEMFSVHEGIVKRVSCEKE